MIVEKREQAVGSSDPEDEEETDEAKAKHLADQEVKIFFSEIILRTWKVPYPQDYDEITTLLSGITIP